MEDNVPSLLTKKKFQINQEGKKQPVVPNKSAKYVKQLGDHCASLSTKTPDNLISVPFSKTPKIDQDVTLLAFRSSKTDFEEYEGLAENSRNSCNTDTDNSDLPSFRGVLRRSFERKPPRHKRSGCYNDTKVKEISDDKNIDSTSPSSLSHITHMIRSDSSIKSLRQTFDEYKSLLNADLFERSDKLTDKKKSNYDKFKRISEIPQFIQLKIDREADINQNSPVNNTTTYLVGAATSNFKNAPGTRATVICTNNCFEISQEHDAMLPSLSKDTKSPKTPSSINEEPFGGYISEDGLSDDGDVVLNDDDELEFGRPSSEVMLHSVPIVPSHQHQMTDRRGFLFKYTSRQVSRLTSKLVATWQKRWVTIDSKFLVYFSSPKSMISRRVLPVCNMLNVKQIIKPAEQHPYQFKIIMKHKMAISFASDSSDDMSLWTSIIMKSILDASTDVEHFKSGGIFQSPDMQGYARLEGTRGRKYLACNRDVFVVFNTQSDFESHMPIFMLNMQLLSVRDVNKMKLQINTPQSSHILNFESYEEMNAWKQALESSISCSLGDDEVMNKVYSNHSNRFCADCETEGPEWASINLGITLCQICAGIHRKMVNAKIKSLRMDFKVWSENLIEMMKMIGNDNSNKVWGHSLKIEKRINQTAELFKRRQFIEDKYSNKRFFNAIQEKEVNQELKNSLQAPDIPQVLQATFSGADVAKIVQEINENSSETEISPPLMEFLRQNISQIRK